MKSKVIVLAALALFGCTVMAIGQSVKNPSFKCGFASQVEAGVLIHDGFAGEYANISSGYHVLPGLFAGIGIGIKDQRFNTTGSTKSFLVPTFAHVKYSFLNKSVSPFIDLKGGLVSDFSGSLRSMPESYPKFGCGHFFRVGIGVDYKRYSLYVGDDWSNLSYNGVNASSSDYSWVIGGGIRF